MGTRISDAVRAPCGCSPSPFHTALSIARLSGGVAIIQVGAQTETELKEKKLRVEDALNATKASSHTLEKNCVSVCVCVCVCARLCACARVCFLLALPCVRAPCFTASDLTIWHLASAISCRTEVKAHLILVMSNVFFPTLTCY